jgi:hypothetical protein
VLTEVLGYSDEKIAELETAGAIGCNKLGSE